MITTENFESSVMSSDKPVLLDFWATWCVYCRRLSPVVERLAEKLGDSITFYMVDIDDQPEIARQYGISAIPSLLLFNNGGHGETLVAPSSQTQVEEWLQSQLQ